MNRKATLLLKRGSVRLTRLIEGAASVGIIVTCLILLGVLVLGTYYYFIWSVADEKAKASSASFQQQQKKSNQIMPQAMQRDSQAPALLSRSVEPMPVTSLPPANVPLASYFGILKNASDAGDFHASCRLGTELLRCAHRSERLAARENVSAELAKLAAGDPERGVYESRLNSITKGIARDNVVCEGFTNVENAHPWEYLLKAGQSGHVPSMILFTSVPPSLPTEFFSNIDGWAAYKENAGPFLVAAANAGHAGSIAQLADEYMNDSFLSILRMGIRRAPTDYQQAAVYSYLLERTGGDERARSTRSVGRMKRLQQLLTPQQLDEARKQADYLASTWVKTGTSPQAWELPEKPDRDADYFCER